jgi:hypothetical protein
MATTDRGYWVVTWRPDYARLVGAPDDSVVRVLVAAPEAGFTSEGFDLLRQVKERFLEAEFDYQGVELERTAETFDELFTIVEIDQVVELE